MGALRCRNLPLENTMTSVQRDLQENALRRENTDPWGRLDALAENGDLWHRISDLEGNSVEEDHGSATYHLYLNPWLL
jgi:hypothetical protein